MVEEVSEEVGGKKKARGICTYEEEEEGDKDEDFL